MELKPGFKQTEAGVIPADWNVCRIDSICRLVNGRGFKPYEWRQTGLPIIRIQNLNGSDDFNCFSGIYDKKIEVEPGQLLFAWSGSRGTSFGPHIWWGTLGLLNYHTWKVQVSESKVDQRFLFYTLKNLTTFIEDRAHGASALVHTQKWEMEGFLVAIPPDINEQLAIASALSDADALIESLEQLLTKKRQIKQGAIQELLTGKRRLPGFSGTWEIRRLGDIAEISMGRTPPRLNQDYWGPGFKWLSIADLRSKVVAESKEEITSLAASEMQVIPKGSLLMSFKLSIGRLCFAGCDLYTNEAICSFQKLQADPEYTYYALGRTDFSLYGKQAVKGYTLNKESLKSVEIAYPKLAEQKAIGDVIASMDVEISALEAKLAKARQIKQGMMQELLTGRIRLVPPKTTETQ